jgi:DNA-binding LytR/AlgR family response regulator
VGAPGARAAVAPAARAATEHPRGPLHGPHPPESEMVAAANVRNGSTRLIPRGSILYVQSHGDFVRIVSDDGRYLIRTTLGDVERRWEQFGFVRVHRQYVANLTRAVELRPLLGGTAELAFGDGQTIPIARRHVAELSRRLGV